MPIDTRPLTTLHPQDLLATTRRLPKAVRDEMKRQGEKLILAGGFVRACVSREPAADIDLFTTAADKANDVALILAESDTKRVHRTPNAFTIRGFKPDVQIIHRWTFATPEEVIPSFDFTIARAAVWWRHEIPGADGAPPTPAAWQSLCDPDFYCDLAAKRIVYRRPVRIEEAGGSLLRVLKFYQRGFCITLDSLGEVLARMLSGVPPEKLSDGNRHVANLHGPDEWERQVGHIMTGLLRLVDPLVDPDHVTHLPDASKPATDDDADTDTAQA